jgi:hypothetical protein
MSVRASSTSILVASLVASDILAAVYGRHEPFHHKRTELTVTDGIYVTVDWSDGEKLGAECRTDWLPPPKDAAVSHYAATSVADAYVPPTSSTVPPSSSYTTVNGTEFVQQPKSTSITLAAAPSTPAAVPTIIATAAASPTTDVFKKRGLAYNDAALTQLFIGSNSKVSWAYNWGQKTSGLASGLEYVPMLWNNNPSLTGPWATAASNAIASGSSHLFSFNEPDVSNQANMDVNTAAQAYISYIQPFAGKAKLGAPAVTNGGGSMGLTYLSNFISNCSGCIINFVNIHWYDSATNIAYFKSHVEQAYTAGGNRPVWITEFAATGTEDEQNTFLEVVIPWLDAQPYVERYAYFMCSQGILISGNGRSTLGTTFMSFT